MVRGVKCDLSGECGLCLYWYASGKWSVHLATCRRKWQLVDGKFTLDKSGGNEVLLINGSFSEFGDSWYKKWTSFCCYECLFYRITTVLAYSLIRPSIHANAVDLWSNVGLS